MLRVAMARPERRNAFDAALIDELAAAFADVGDARAVVLAGRRARRSPQAPTSSGCARRSTSPTTRTSPTRCACARCSTRSTPAPRPWSAGCRVTRSAAAAASSPAATSSLPSRAQFAFSEVKLGIVPAVISPFALAKIGPGAARRYFVTGERFSAAEALRIGLIHEVADDLDEQSSASWRGAHRRPPGGAGREGACADAASGRRDGAPHRRAPREPGGPGGPAGVPREADAVLARVGV